MLLFHPPTIVEIGMVGLSFILPTCLQNRCIILYTLIVGVREYGEAANNLEFNNLYIPNACFRFRGRTVYDLLHACALRIDQS